MKLTIASKVTANQYRIVKAVAVIKKSKKLGIPRRFQRTVKVRTVAPDFALEEMRKSFEKDFERWEKRVMAKIAAEKQPKVEPEKDKELI